MKKTIGIIVVLAILAVGLLVFFYKKEGSRVNKSTTEQTQVQPESAVSPVSSVKEFTVVGKNYSFSPNVITVSKGDKVKITFQDDDGHHDFKIDGLNVISKTINSGQSDVVEFTADKVGTFEYYCSVGQHRQLGMKGTLVVQ